MFFGRNAALLVAVVMVMAPCAAGAPPVSQPGPRSPADTLKSLHLPPGFSARLFAGEPDLVQPIGFCFDDRGRIWVAESFAYPKWKAEGNDRISVFEDTDGDGRCDRKTVFYDKLNYVTGVEVGFGGMWVLSPPNLLFIPDKDGDDKPDGPPQVLLDGFGHQGVHNLVNGMAWGPDGWLYAGHGGSSWGWIGPPEMPVPPEATPGADAIGTAHRHPAVMGAPPQRIFYDGGVWRYHPQRKVFEPVMEGTTNPWGMDFDDYGQMFVSNSVTPHLYHVIPGSHVERRRPSPNNRYAYDVIGPAADHKHWTGKSWSDSRGGTDAQVLLGGGHAHCGLMVYLGGTWPEGYRNTILMNNLHGDRMNNDLPRRDGSGYAAAHGKDFLWADDNWYFALHVKYGPDGNAFLSDWYDTGECHTLKPNTRNGRIYKIAYDGGGAAAVGVKAPAAPFDVAKLPSAELVRLQASPNDWWVRRARGVLQERGPDPAVHRELAAVLGSSATVPVRLRALWALHVTGGATRDLLLSLLNDPSEYVRGWAVRLLADDRDLPPDVAPAFARLARDDPSPWVRLHLAGAMTRVPLARRWEVLTALAGRAEDAADRNLPLLCWYALEPLAAADPRRALALASGAKIPKLREFAVRRIAERAR